MTDYGMPEGSSGLKARQKGPESDLRVGTLILNGVRSHWGDSEVLCVWRFSCLSHS